MAQTSRPNQDYENLSYGEQGQVHGGTVVAQQNGVVVGGIDASGKFERLPVGTSAAGTAVLVDLIAGESVVVTVGTMTVGTIDLLKAGTLTALANGTLGAGTLNTLGTVGTIPGVGSVAGVGVVTSVGSISGVGVVTSVGSVPGVGVVSSLSAGSVAVIAGTGIITSGSIAVVAGTVQNAMVTGTLNEGTIDLVKAGTLTALANGTLGAGTLNTLGTVGTVPGVGVVSSLTAGSVAVTAGTTIVTSGSIAVTAGTVLNTTVAGTMNTLGTVGTVPGVGSVSGVGVVTSLSGGTVTALANGTLGAGTLNTLGTVGTIPGIATVTNVGSITSVGSVYGLGGTQNVTLTTLISGEDQTNDVLKTEQQMSYFHHVGTAGSTSGTIKTSAGLLHSIVFGNHTSGGTYTLYDSVGTSATVIGVITSGAMIPPVTALYDIKFTTGLTVVSGSVCDLTFNYR